MTSNADTSGSESIISMARSQGIAMQAVARASAKAQEEAITVALRVEVMTGRPVMGEMVWPTMLSDVVR